MVELDTVLLKVASRCNLDCSYCYVYNMGDSLWAEMPKQMSPSTMTAVAQALGEVSRFQQRPFSVVLHGGEPLLLGSTGVEQLLYSLRLHLPVTYPIGIQTNGILISQAILDTCFEYRSSLSVSIDGPNSIHDRNRRAHGGAGSFDSVVAGIDLLLRHPKSHALFSGILAVIDPQSDVAAVYRFFKELGVPSIDFLQRDGNHTRLPYGKACFGSTEYGQWACRLLDIYLADPEPPRIRFLDELIKLILRDHGKTKGMGSPDLGIVIIDTDGSIAKNDTLKSSYSGADRFKQRWSIFTHSLIAVLNSTEFTEYYAMQRPTSDVCLTCSDLPVCAGGMEVHRWSDARGFDNPSIYCADQRLLITHIRERLAGVFA